MFTVLKFVKKNKMRTIKILKIQTAYTTQIHEAKQRAFPYNPTYESMCF